MSVPPRTRRSLLVMLAAIAVVVVSLLVWSVLGHEESGSAARFADAKQLPPELAELGWDGRIDYHFSSNTRGREYWVAGRADLEHVTSFCRSWKLELHFGGCSLDARAFGLDPRVFGVAPETDSRCGRAYCRGLGHVTIYYIPDERRLIVRVVQNAVEE